MPDLRWLGRSSAWLNQGGLEGLVQQHLRTLRRLEQLAEQAAEFDVTPAELGQLEEEARRLQGQIKAVLASWQHRLS